MKIMDNVIKLDCTKGAYVYAIIDNGVTLIDSGLPRKGAAILKELQSLGIRPEEVKKVLLTHNDVDHTGNIAFLQERCGCEILVSKEDHPQILGLRKRYGVKRIVGGLVKVKAPKRITCLDGNPAESIRIIATPGHTPGHLCFRYKNMLFAGDLVRTGNGRLGKPPGFMNWNGEELIRSIRTLPMDGVEWICPAHGEPVRTGGNNWEEFVKRVARH